MTMNISVAILLLTTAGISVPLAVYAWKRRAGNGAVPLAIMACGVIVWTSCSAIHPFVRSAALAETVVALQLLGVSAIPPSLLLFAVSFTGLCFRWKKAFIFLSILMGISVFALASTNRYHELVWHGVERNGLVRSETWIVYWAFIAYIYALSLTSIAILVERTFGSSSIFRWQSVTIVLAITIPLVVFPLHSLNFIQTSFDPTPLSFFFSLVLIWWGLFQFQLLDLKPAPYSLLIDSMSDGIVVVDDRERIVEMNKTAREFFQEVPGDATGRQADDVIAAWPQIQAFYRSNDGRPREIELLRGEEPLILVVRSTPLSEWRGNLHGRLLIFRDVTELRNALNDVQILSGLLPICSHCKNIRDDRGYWQQLEEYMATHSDFTFSHSICPECIEKHYPQFKKKITE